MSKKDSGQSKSEKATPQKLRQAREKGQVPRSKDLAAAALIIGCATLLTTSADWMASQMAELTRFNMMITKEQLFEEKLLERHLGNAFLSILTLLGPLFLLVGVLAMVAGALPGGPLLSFKNASFKYSRIDPIAGLGRMVSKKTLVELVKSILKITLLISIMLFFLRANFQGIMATSQLPIDEAVRHCVSTVSSGLFYLGVGLLIIAFIDVPYQYWHHHNELKMSHQEVKDEHKQQEGKPEIKAKIRQMQQKISRSRADIAVPQADVLLVNPSHYSVALRYDTDKADAPFVIAKGMDEQALYMREVAAKHDVEIVAIPALARAVYYSTKIEQQIPAALFVAIAHVLSYVMQIKAARAGKQPKPEPLPHFNIPPHLRRD